MVWSYLFCGLGHVHWQPNVWHREHEGLVQGQHRHGDGVNLSPGVLFLIALCQDANQCVSDGAGDPSSMPRQRVSPFASSTDSRCRQPGLWQEAFYFPPMFQCWGMALERGVIRAFSEDETLRSRTRMSVNTQRQEEKRDMRSCVGKRFWRVDSAFQIRLGANLATSSSFDSR